MSAALAHVMVVGGTPREWAAIDDAGWERVVADLGPVVADAGGSWLTIRAYGAGDGDHPDAGDVRRTRLVADGRCTVIIDPEPDGRALFAAAMRRLPATAAVDEKSVTTVLYEPADVEPDLVVVLGPSTRLPPSLVWELAYGELVFLDGRLTDLGADHLAAALDDYRSRRRRFGGLDS